MFSFVMTRLVALFVVLLSTACVAQFAPFQATNLTTIVSPADPGISISYKVPDGVCNTAFKTQQQYTGWVNVPGAYETNIFFWFVAARQPTSQLTIWLNGGPGSSSMFGFFTETGPCEVVERGADRLETVARQWGWDRASNLLFIDQPNQVGFSYDVPTNGSFDMVYNDASVPPRPVPRSRTPTTYLNGTFSSLNQTNTANTTVVAATAVWHMVQGFLGTFPQFNPANNSAVGVNLFAESYGGKYGPVFAEIWEQQNVRRSNGTLSNSTLDIHLVSLGIVNGCVDDIIQGPSYATMSVNNTYGIQLLSPVRAALANGTFYQSGGCLDLINECRAAADASDPENDGDVDSVNSICSQATTSCNSATLEPYSEASRSYYDIAHIIPDSYPSYHYATYLNTRRVQDAIGARVNYSDSSPEVYSAFQSTGDWQRGPMAPKLAALLNRGVRIGLVYGDRDFICNWIGGEAVSLAVADLAGPAYSSRFRSAGYAPIIVNDTYIGGVVRQYGNLSFSRVYQAGHFVPAYQPETAFQIFARIILGTSLSTGEPVNLNMYNTTGPLNATSTLSLPPSPTATCYLRNMAGTCPDDSISSILAGEGFIVNEVWYSASSAWPGATSSVTATGQMASTSTPPTLTGGIFTATATPSSATCHGRCAAREKLVLAAIFILIAALSAVGGIGVN
ncbi:serine carboxypeptidase [Coniochaeta sp. 2T2.1]|nr:serine carboxypeptidase [Coniochaeta sp. 2T2.1]